MRRGEDGTLPVLALRSLVLFPGTDLPAVIGRRASLDLLGHLDVGARLLVGLQKEEEVEEPTASDIHPICVEGTVSRIVVEPAQRVLIMRGVRRRRLTKVTRESPFIVAESEVVQEGRGDPEEMAELESAIISSFREVERLDWGIAPAAVERVEANRTVEIADLVASMLGLEPKERASLLLALDLPTRRHRLLAALERRVEHLRGGRFA